MEKKLIVVIFVVTAALLVSGCCCCYNYVPSGPAPTWNDIDAGNIGLVGAWGDTGIMGNIVDAAGNFVGDAYAAEAYRFYDDGTYQYRIIGSGLAITGLAEVHGEYGTDGDRLQLYNNLENWYPATGESQPGYKNRAYDDLSYDFRLEDDGNTLVLIDESGVESFYHRVDIDW